MGYRSEVGFACDPILKEMMFTLAKWDKSFNEFLNDGEDLACDDFGRWRWDWVKWYDSYPEIEIMTNIMEMCEESSSELLSYDSYGFIRIGEELEDNEIRGEPSSFDLYINRSLDI